METKFREALVQERRHKEDQKLDVMRKTVAKAKQDKLMEYVESLH